MPYLRASGGPKWNDEPGRMATSSVNLANRRLIKSAGTKNWLLHVHVLTVPEYFCLHSFTMHCRKSANRGSPLNRRRTQSRGYSPRSFSPVNSNRSTEPRSPAARGRISFAYPCGMGLAAEDTRSVTYHTTRRPDLTRNTRHLWSSGFVRGNIGTGKTSRCHNSHVLGVDANKVSWLRSPGEIPRSESSFPFARANGHAEAPGS